MTGPGIKATSNSRCAGLGHCSRALTPTDTLVISLSPTKPSPALWRSSEASWPADLTGYLTAGFAANVDGSISAAEVGTREENRGIRMTDKITDHPMEVELKLRFPATGRAKLERHPSVPGPVRDGSRGAARGNHLLRHVRPRLGRNRLTCGSDEMELVAFRPSSCGGPGTA